MLRALRHLKFCEESDSVPVSTPKTMLYNAQARVQVIEDLQPAGDLASILSSNPSVCANKPDYITLGSSLGRWLRRFHAWTQEAAQADLRRTIALNTSSQDLKWRTTYHTIVDIAKAFPTISKEDMNTLQAVRARALHEHEQHLQSHSSNTVVLENYGLVHADFWTGKQVPPLQCKTDWLTFTRSVLFTASPSPQLYVIDWEFVQLGHRAMDLGQFIGDLLEKSYMLSSVRSQCESMLCSFVKSYGAVSEEMGFRVVMHAGVHMINWCARHPDADLKRQVEVLLQRAVEMIARAWKQDRGWFQGDVLGCLFAGAV